MIQNSFSQIRSNINPFQHVLIMGQTGAGKNMSALNPYLQFIVDNENHFYSSAILAIDPKNELRKVIEESERSYDIITRDGISQGAEIEGHKKIDFFESFDHETEKHESYSDKLIKFLDNFIDRDNTDPFWNDQADQFIRAIFELEFFVSSKHRLKAYNERFWTGFKKHLTDKIADLDYMQAHCNDENERNSYRSMVKAYNKYLNVVKEEISVFKIYRFLLYNPFLLNEYLTFLQKVYLNSENTNGYQFLDYLYQLHASKTHGQFYGIVGAASNYLDVLISEELENVINFQPFMDHDDRYSVKDCLEQSKIVLFKPDPLNQNDDKLGKVLKSLFFEFSFLRRNKNLPFFYFCDEFQKYITTDKASGEANFLDRCRSFNVACILATQSTSSLHNTLLLEGKNTSEVEASVNSMLSNIGTKFYFRSTDTNTNNDLKQLIPQSPVLNQPHIIDVRPLSTLKVGECYYSLSDGSWGRKQIKINKRT